MVGEIVMKRFFLSCLLVVCLAGNSWALLQPQQQIEEMVNSVLEVLQQPELSHQEKKARVSGRVQQHLNMASMAQRTLGPFWDEATELQRQRFTELFVKVLEGTYLNRINDYSGGTVEYLKQRIKGDKAIIDTKFVSEELEIPVQYKMLREGANWQVFDVIIEGVSLIRNYRSTYGEIIRKDGYEGLFDRMEKKIVAMNSSQK